MNENDKAKARKASFKSSKLIRRKETSSFSGVEFNPLLKFASFTLMHENGSELAYQLGPGKNAGCQGSDVGLEGSASHLNHILAEEDAFQAFSVFCHTHAAERIVLAAKMRPQGGHQLVLCPPKVPWPASHPGVKAMSACMLAYLP